MALRTALDTRFADCGLTLHPDKTKIVYCKDESRRGTHPVFKFDFLGYTFRPRIVSKRAGGMGVSFGPAASPTALKAIRGLSGVGPCIVAVTRLSMIWRGCSTRTFAAGSTTTVGSVLRLSIQPCGTSTLLGSMGLGKFKSLRGHKRRSRHWLARIAQRQPRLFAHWPCSMEKAEQWEPDDARVSRPVLRERGGEIPPRHSPLHPHQWHAALSLAASTSMA